MKVSEIFGIRDMLGSFFYVNKSERERLITKTWRCADRGHLLGYTLGFEGSEIYLAVIDDPHPELKLIAPGAVSRTDLESLNVENFLGAVIRGQISWDDMAAYRAGRKWWIANFEGDETVMVGCTCRSVVVPVSFLSQSKKKIMIKLTDYNL